MTNVYGLLPEDLMPIFEKFNLPGKYRALQVLEHVYQNKAQSFHQMSNVKSEVKEYLNQNYKIQLPEASKIFRSNDGTIKILIRLEDNQFIETVIIPEPERVTLCVSSQVGCAMKCTFCHTGTQGFTRHLQTHEIVGQVLLAQTISPQPITNIVYMGMGEPLHNFDNTMKSLKILNEYLRFGVRKITVSTSGLVPEIAKMGQIVNVNLAISLHGATDEVRSVLVPLNKKYNVASLMKACREYPLGPRRKITFEYTIIKGVNDRAEDAKDLVKVLQGIPALLNIIPMNPHPCSVYQPPHVDDIYVFQKIILNAGIRSTVRKTRGQDILAACGQLKAKETAQGLLA